MYTLLLRVAAPQQSWGDHSRFNHRETRREPTKSGILGMVAAAEGRRRDADLSDLAELQFGVRIDQPGLVETDFQTEIDWRTGKSKALTHRSYLSDAKFLVVLSSANREKLESISESLRNPAFPLFLGRRAFPPAGRLVLEIREGTLADALQEAPWLASTHERERHPTIVHLDTIRDASEGEPVDEVIQDVPVCFDLKDRRHSSRAVVRYSVEMENPSTRRAKLDQATPMSTAHDPFTLLGGE